MAMPSLSYEFCTLSSTMVPTRQHRRLVAICLFLLVIGLLSFWSRLALAWRDFGYLTRPLWDHPERPFTVIPHYPSGNLSSHKWCSLHGWTPRPSIPKVFDAIIFSVELDLLEIRLRELYDVVDKFVVLESDYTFTGLPKNRTFANNQERFSWAADKIHYAFHAGHELKRGQVAFDQEAELRISMNSALLDAGVQDGDLVLMSDVDELPRFTTMELLKTCDFGDTVHLQLQNFLYSFEFLFDMDSWRASVRRHPSDGYSHGRVGEKLLADAGWHCSFCFKHIEDFQFKMQAYSHADRSRQQLLDGDRIQKVICDGTDIFDMYPEAYSWSELARKLAPMAKTNSAMDVPRFLTENPDAFAYLLPGGCMRESVQPANGNHTHS